MEQRYWTIRELVELASRALREGYWGQTNRQRSDFPSERTVRYYTTLGLIDRPLSFKGRVALYGARHVKQLVAIKRLQSEGFSLEEIQQRLLGTSDQEVEKIAGLPEDVLLQIKQFVENQISSTSAVASRQTSAFWRVPPAAPPSESKTVQQSLESGSLRERFASYLSNTANASDSLNDSSRLAIQTIQRVLLADGIELHLHGAHRLSHSELEEIEKSARPLLNALRNIGLVRKPTNNDKE